MQTDQAFPRTLPQWFKFLYAPGGDNSAPARVRTVTQGQIETIQTLLAMHEKRWGWLKNWKVAALFGLFVAATFTTLSFASLMEGLPRGRTVAGTFILVLLAAWSLAALLMAVARTMGGPHSAYWVANFVEPLTSKVGGCERALKLVNKHADCRAYRDAVLAAGRALMNVDLRMLELLARKAEQDLRANKHEAMCRELHGVPT